MYNFPSMCYSSPINPQVLFYNGHGINFYYRSLDIICRHNIQSFILKAGDSVHDQKNNNVPNMKLNNFYGNTRMNWMIHHRNLKFTPPHMNYVIVETCEYFKPQSVKINQKYFKNTPPSPQRTSAPTTKLVLMVLNSQTEIT